MKKKLNLMGRVAIALVLALSLSLVMAAPVAADSPADTDVGFELSADPPTNSTATWDDTEQGTGTYSVKLNYASGDNNPYVQFTPTPGITVNDLAAITDGWSWWYQASAANGPLLELRFTSADNVDPDGAGHVDITVNTAELSPETTGTTEEVTSESTCIYYGNDPTDGTAFGDGTGSVTLAGVLAAINASDEMTEAVPNDTATAWELTRVRMELWPGAARSCYIDDIEINGTTYELEPIFLDKEAYNVGATVEVTVPNFAANTDPIRVNPITGEPGIAKPYNWSVTVTSTSDPSGITVDLEETGFNTGVFTGSFATADTTPAAEDEVYVEEGDTITVTYGEDNADWGAGDSTTSIDASVDDTAPTIADLTPGDGDKVAVTTPEISATYADDPDVSGIDIDSVEIIFDGVDVTDDDATTIGLSSVSYTPTDDLADGSYDVTVNVSDNAGNEITETWSFRVVSWLVDTVGPQVSPLDALETVGVAVSITGDDDAQITVGRYASNPEPEAPPAFDMIEDGFFDVEVTDADTATQIVIKFADDNITSDSRAHVWDELEGAWLECSDQGYNSVAEYLWVKVRDDTTPNIAELTGTPFAISGVEEVEEDISAYYRGLGDDAEVVETTDLLTAANDWADEVIPSGFTESILTTELLALANEWAATE